MLVGVIAFNVLRVIPPEEPRAIGVLLVGYAFQGLGTLSQSSYSCGVSLTQRRLFHDILLHMYLYHSVRPSILVPLWIHRSLISPATRIMMTGFLEGHQANGAFVAVGPPGKYDNHNPHETLS